MTPSHQQYVLDYPIERYIVISIARAHGVKLRGDGRYEQLALTAGVPKST